MGREALAVCLSSGSCWKSIRRVIYMRRVTEQGHHVGSGGQGKGSGELRPMGELQRQDQVLTPLPILLSSCTTLHIRFLRRHPRKDGNEMIGATEQAVTD